MGRQVGYARGQPTTCTANPKKLGLQSAAADKDPKDFEKAFRRVAPLTPRKPQA